MTTSEQVRPLLVSQADAAVMLGVSERTVKQYVADGMIDVVRLRGSTRIRIDAIHALIEENRVRRGGGESP